MKTFRMCDVRIRVAQAFRLPDAHLPVVSSPYYYSLPKTFSTHPEWVVFKHEDGKDYKIKVLSTAEAKETSKTKTTRPHRILVWDEICNCWQFAGKFAQHCKSRAHGDLKAHLDRQSAEYRATWKRNGLMQAGQR